MIIGLAGNPRAGKDEVANFLVKHYNFKKIAFADQIKEEYFTKVGLTIDKYEKLKKDGEAEEVRRSLWDFSKRVKESKGQDYFIKAVLDKINNSNNWVITDIRTKLELESVLGHGTKVIFVKRSDKELEIEDSELSANDIIKFIDDVIINDQETIEKFENNLKEFFRRRIMKSEEPYKSK